MSLIQNNGQGATANESGAGATVQRQLAAVHGNIKESFPGIARVAVALHDDKTDRLKTFVHSSDGAVPFSHYDAALSEVPVLAELAETRRDRVVEDMSALGPEYRRGRKVAEAGYLSSYTTPFYDRGRFVGFLFFDAHEKGYFSESAPRHLAVFSHLISLLIINGLAPVQMLRSSVNMARDLSRYRDQETGAHLDRMSRYARIIAGALADARGLSDEFAEFVFLFAPLHDIGKIGIEDSILLKPGRLSEGEFTVMKSHVAKGVDMVDSIIREFGLAAIPHTEILRNIVRFHHESFDGAGYLDGLRGEAIPLEARIVAAADVFDALTSTRPYKQAWSVDRAVAYLREKSGTQLDPGCVAALLDNRAAIEAVKRQFVDEETHAPAFHEAYTRAI